MRPLVSLPGSWQQLMGRLACRAPLLAQQTQAQSQQLALAQPTDAYLTSRAEALRNVESTIHDLGQIFNQLAVMARPCCVGAHGSAVCVWLVCRLGCHALPGAHGDQLRRCRSRASWRSA